MEKDNYFITTIEANKTLKSCCEAWWDSQRQERKEKFLAEKKKKVSFLVSFYTGIFISESFFYIGTFKWILTPIYKNIWQM